MSHTSGLQYFQKQKEICGSPGPKHFISIIITIITIIITIIIDYPSFPMHLVSRQSASNIWQVSPEGERCTVLYLYMKEKKYLCWYWCPNRVDTLVNVCVCEHVWFSAQDRFQWTVLLSLITINKCIFYCTRVSFHFFCRFSTAAAT